LVNISLTSLIVNCPNGNELEGKPISQLQSELRSHTDTKKKTDLGVKDIQKRLKDLLLVHHATIKDLQRQVIQMHRKIAVIVSSKNMHGPIQLVRRYLEVGMQ
jgi:hypothetical protein